MKNYINEARKHSITIYPSCLESNLIASYTLNKESSHVSIKYLDGQSLTEEIQETTEEELNTSLDETLDFYRQKIIPKINQQIGWKWSLVFLDLLNSSLQYATQNYFAGTCWLTCASLYYLQIHGPYKLKREIELVSWFHDHEQQANEVIKSEVESKIQRPEITTQTLNIPTYEYPQDLVPYPKNIYEYGLNLNNIHELNNKQLRKLKRKVLRKERKK